MGEYPKNINVLVTSSAYSPRVLRSPARCVPTITRQCFIAISLGMHTGETKIHYIYLYN